MPPDYRAEYLRAYQENIDNIEVHMKEGRLDKKIESFCERFGFVKEEVEKAIKSCRIVAAQFALDPSKQNLYEKVAAKHIRNLPGVTQFRHLSTNELWVANGGVFDKKQKKESGISPDAKSVDFTWEYGAATYYASHKHTQDEGGAQGNAYKDLCAFIDACNKPQSAPRFFLVIADGNFFQGRADAGTTRLQALKARANRINVHACDIGELPELMEKLSGTGKH